jgi:cytidine diphosphoramidate kinase
MQVSENQLGTVFWITGLAGSGKSSIGACLYMRLKEEKNNVIFLDGDKVREMMGNDLGYEISDRIKNAYRISSLCKFLSDQGHDVICSTISLFPEILDWNRANIEHYFQIYIKVSKNILHERNQKGLYSGVIAGTEKNVMGVDLDFHNPENSDLIIENNDKLESFDEIVNSIQSLS